jgi:hypothetical protein
VPTVLKCGSLKLLEPSGPVQACTGFALPFTYHANLYRPYVIKMSQVTFISNVKEVGVKARSILHNDVLPAEDKDL